MVNNGVPSATDKIVLTKRNWLTDEVFELEFYRSENFTWQPGQHIRFHHDGIKRDNTPISISKEKNLRICVKHIITKHSRQYVPCLSDTEKGKLSSGFPGRVTEYLEQSLSNGRYHFYLCGKREMILDAMAVIDERFPDSRVFTERFT